MNGRVYDPLVGRVVSSDPNYDCGLQTQGWNRYSYVGNKTLSATDPTGFWTWCIRAYDEGWTWAETCIEIDVGSLICGYVFTGFGGGAGNEPVEESQDCVSHAYESPASLLCLKGSNPCCTMDRAKDRLAYHVYPGQSSSDPIGPVPVTRFANVFGIGGPITSEYNRNAGLGINRTRPEHPFHDGKVERELSENSVGVFITTRGSGCNRSYGSVGAGVIAAANTAAGYVAFAIENTQLALELTDCVDMLPDFPWWFGPYF